MFKNILNKVGLGALPSNFAYTVGDKVEVPFQSIWALHKGQKRADGSPVSIFIYNKKELGTSAVAAAKNAEQVSKTMRHPNVLKALDSCEVDAGLYLVTEAVVPLLSLELPEDEWDPAVWGFFQAADALQFLHTSGFTHGLFGPATIFVTSQGDYRLGGFELCRKNADASAMLNARHECDAAITGWPQPPPSLKDGPPAICLDLWGVTVLAAYVFGSSRAKQRGVGLRLDLARTPQDLPAELRRPFAELQKTGPMRGDSPLVTLLANQYLLQHPAVRIMSFLTSLHIRSAEEQEVFFGGLPGLLDSISRTTQTQQVLPELMKAQKFPGQEAAQVLPSVLKISAKLKGDEFKDNVAPLVVQLFASSDRAVRFRLLSSLGDMIDNLDDYMINEKIFPECVNGFSDSNGPIREATVKSLVIFAPRLKAKLIETRVVKILLKLLQDPEPSIRTNTVICCGRISSYLPKASASQTLSQVISAGMKDGFAPCRSSSLSTLLATVSLFGLDELSGRMMPYVCQRLADPDPGVSDNAFRVLSSLQEHVRTLVDERRAQSQEASGQGEEASTDAAAAAGKDGSTWGSWAFSTAGSAASLMGSMAVRRMSSFAPDSTSFASDSTPTAATPTATPEKPSFTPPPPNDAGAKRPSSIAQAMDDDGVDGAAGWGDDDDDFFEEFNAEKKTAAPTAAAPAPAPKASLPTASKPTPSSGMALGRSSNAGQQSVPKPAAKVEAAKPLPKVEAKPMATKLDDDDFWKEFDMDS